MNTYEDAAVDAVRDYLIELLKERQWCRARQVGGALRALIEGETSAAGILTVRETPDRDRPEAPQVD